MTEDEKLAVDPNAIVRSITVQIDAPAQIVWEVLVDFDRYSEWNPFCVEASGVLEVGEPLSMKLKSYTEEGQYFDNVEIITEVISPVLSPGQPHGSTNGHTRQGAISLLPLQVLIVASTTPQMLSWDLMVST